jgi:hypothetical protein
MTRTPGPERPSGVMDELCWNLVLRTTGANAAFSHDLPFRPFPISWQDTGSGGRMCGCI